MKYLADFEVAAQSGEFKGLKPVRTELLKEVVRSQNKYGVWVTETAVISRAISGDGIKLAMHADGDHDLVEVFPYFDNPMNDTAKVLLAARAKNAAASKANNGQGNTKR